MLTSWNEVNTSGTPYRYQTISTLGYPVPSLSSHISVNFGRCMLVYGGENADAYPQNELYSLNLDTFKWKRYRWKPNPVDTQPPKLEGHSCHIIGNELYICGGYGLKANKDDEFLVYKLNLDAMKWTLISSRNNPRSRKNHASVLKGNELLVFGGRLNDEYFNDMHSLSLSTLNWKRVDTKGDIPSPRAGHSAILGENVVIFFGGMNQKGEYLNDLYVFNIEKAHFERVQATGDIPPGIERHACVVHGNSMFVYGGYKFGAASNALYELNLDSFVWKMKSTAPHKLSRYACSAIMGEGNHMIIFGGRDQFLDRSNQVFVCLFDGKPIQIKKTTKTGIDLQYENDDIEIGKNEIADPYSVQKEYTAEPKRITPERRRLERKRRSRNIKQELQEEILVPDTKKPVEEPQNIEEIKEEKNIEEDVKNIEEEKNIEEDKEKNIEETENIEEKSQTVELPSQDEGPEISIIEAEQTEIITEEEAVSQVEKDTQADQKEISFKEKLRLAVLDPNQEKIAELEEKRKKIMKEILSTERTYVQDLNICVQRFKIPLIEKEIISKDQIDDIFAGLDLIIEINTAFLQKLENIVEKEVLPNQEIEISNLICEFAPKFKFYSVFVTNYKHSSDTIRLLNKKNKEFNQFLTNTAIQLTNEGIRINKIGSYLITPIQRLPRYKLLLQDLLKSTPEAKTETRKHITQAINAVQDAANYLNTKQREAEDLLKLINIQTDLGLKDLAQDGRVFIKEGKAQRRMKRGKSTACFLYLFNDLFIIQDIARSRRLTLSKSKPLLFDLTKEVKILKDSEPSAFIIESEKENAYIICANTNDRDKWIQDIVQCKA